MACEPSTNPPRLSALALAQLLNKLELKLNGDRLLFIVANEVRFSIVGERQLPPLYSVRVLRASVGEHPVSVVFQHMTAIDEFGAISTDHRVARYMRAVKLDHMLTAPVCRSHHEIYKIALRNFRDLVSSLDGLSFEQFTQIGFTAVGNNGLPNQELNGGV